jgi:hypothetical protein
VAVDLHCLVRARYELHDVKVTPVVAAAETPNVASPLLDWLREGMTR